MAESDPHIHVQRAVVEASVDFRNLLASTLDRAPDAPGVVTTGCGVRAAYAMTSTRPESVTCLACREHAALEYRKLAGQVEFLGQAGAMPGVDLTGEQVVAAVQRLRDLAARFAG
jgi:hypothetical protein